jgi:hypothetical protein
MSVVERQEISRSPLAKVAAEQRRSERLMACSG